MTITQKLIRLTADGGKSRAARAAGLPSSSLSNYITKRQMPRADNALALARAFSVPLDWLADDSQDWPPPPVASVAALSTEQLTDELSHRARGIVEAIQRNVSFAHSVDWIALSRKVLQTDPRKSLPAELRKPLEVPAKLNALRQELEAFIPPMPASNECAERDGKAMIAGLQVGGLAVITTTILEVFKSVERLDRLPGLDQAFELSGVWLAPEGWKTEQHNFPDHAAHLREHVERELQAIQSGAPKSVSRRKPAKT